MRDIEVEELNEFKYDKGLQMVHLNKLKKIQYIKSFTLPQWYKLKLFFKTPNFWKWYCGETTCDCGGIGRMIDHKRIIETKWK